MIGSTLSHYEIQGELGRGGMGIVYKAFDTRLERSVAIKVLATNALTTDRERARFQREAKAAARLQHPNIASIYEIDEATPSLAPAGTEPSPFIVQEYVQGESLDQIVTKGPLKLKLVVRYITQIARALEAAHSQNVVHRDIKPSNVLISNSGVAKVLDFGLAKTEGSTVITREGTTLGTVAYMSPEQAAAEQVDHRTDIFSMGVMLYELVSGVHPFASEYEQAVLYRVMNEDPEPLATIRSNIPDELARIVSKCLAKDPARRYQSMTELIVDLENPELLKGGSSAERVKATLLLQSRAKRLRNYGMFTALGIFLVVLTWQVARSSKSAPEPDTGLVQMKLDIPLSTYGNRRWPRISDDGLMALYLHYGPPPQKIVVIDLAKNTDQIIEIEGSIPLGLADLSPDGERIVFSSEQDEAGEFRLYTLDRDDPVPMDQGRLSGWTRVSWAASNSIYLANEDGLLEFFLDGSPIDTLVSNSDMGGFGAGNIVETPDPDILLFEVSKNASGGGASSFSIAKFDHSTGDHTIMKPNAAVHAYMKPGYVMFADETYDEWIQRFDLESGSFEGERFRAGITVDGSNWHANNNGSLIAFPSDGPPRRKHFFRDDGNTRTEIGVVEDYTPFALTVTPDGKTVLISSVNQLIQGASAILKVQAEGVEVLRGTRDGSRTLDKSVIPLSADYFLTTITPYAGGRDVSTISRHILSLPGPIDSLTVIGTQGPDSYERIEDVFPDGHRLLIEGIGITDPEEPRMELVEYDLETNSSKRIAFLRQGGTGNPGHEADLSPDGSHLIYLHEDGRLHISESDGSDSIPISSEFDAARWFTDSSVLLTKPRAFPVTEPKQWFRSDVNLNSNALTGSAELFTEVEEISGHWQVATDIGAIYGYWVENLPDKLVWHSNFVATMQDAFVEASDN